MRRPFDVAREETDLMASLKFSNTTLPPLRLGQAALSCGVADLAHVGIGLRIKVGLGSNIKG